MFRFCGWCAVWRQRCCVHLPRSGQRDGSWNDERRRGDVQSAHLRWRYRGSSGSDVIRVFPRRWHGYGWKYVSGFSGRKLWIWCGLFTVSFFTSPSKLHITTQKLRSLHFRRSFCERVLSCTSKQPWQQHPQKSTLPSVPASIRQIRIASVLSSASGLKPNRLTRELNHLTPLQE